MPSRRNPLPSASSYSLPSVAPVPEVPEESPDDAAHSPPSDGSLDASAGSDSISVRSRPEVDNLYEKGLGFNPDVTTDQDADRAESPSTPSTGSPSSSRPSKPRSGSLGSLKKTLSSLSLGRMAGTEPEQSYSGRKGSVSNTEPCTHDDASYSDSQDSDSDSPGPGRRVDPSECKPDFRVEDGCRDRPETYGTVEMQKPLLPPSPQRPRRPATGRKVSLKSSSDDSDADWKTLPTTRPRYHQSGPPDGSQQSLDTGGCLPPLRWGQAGSSDRNRK